MGAVVSVVIPAVVAGVVGLIRALRSSDVAPNPTMQDVEEAAAEVERQRLAAAAALQKAQDDADEAKRQVDEAKKKAEEAKQRADEAQRRSDDEKRKAEDAKRKIDQEKKEMEDAKNKAEEEKRHAEAEKKKADEERRNAQEAKDKADREKQNAEEARAQADDDRKKAEDARAQAEEDMRKAEDDAKETRRQAEESRLAAEAERKVVEEQKREAEEAFLRAEEERRLAEEEADRARAEQLEADERASEAQRQADVAKAAQQKALENLQWMRGDRPVVWPTLEEIESAKIRFDYTEGKFHFAIAGLAGSGKSSLINAFRGLTNNDPRAANTGIVETTLYVTGYPDPDPKNPFIWYDIPGAGTLEIPDWQYFNAQGLFVFDCIIVLIDNRFSATDIAILENCKRFNIPSYIVRSKANQHVLNIMNDMGYDFMTDDGTQRAQLLPAARARFIAETRQSVKANLEKAELPPKRVYIVSKDAVVTVIQGKAMRKDTLMDEVELVEDILKEATRRRMKPKQKA
ncbi:hypothetical protein JAAARDRAFT_186517 [Jaapia argillacea MUCL 33604]|uniref:IRG-type G domain-containing protein n=1 Tax=Jaapia argillacea MUCL 33604 TaxID=933084 RepID=A0A067P5P4_9AGAM|nr:hypothetical protein JAAARDRAFT_186517 [Jaapia argillacea MUCL 33604]